MKYTKDTVKKVVEKRTSKLVEELSNKDKTIQELQAQLEEASLARELETSVEDNSNTQEPEDNVAIELYDALFPEE